MVGGAGELLRIGLRNGRRRKGIVMKNKPTRREQIGDSSWIL